MTIPYAFIREINLSYILADTGFSPEDLDKGHDPGADEDTIRRLAWAKAISESDSLDDINLEPDVRYDLYMRAVRCWEGDLDEKEVYSVSGRYADHGVKQAAMDHGRMSFIGFGCDSDPYRALRYLLKGKTDKRYCRAWIDYFLNEPGTDKGKASDYQDYIKFGRQTAHDYDCPLYFYLPEWYVLNSICADSPGYMLYFDPWGAEISTDLFEIHQYRYYVDEITSDSLLPNFAFKPIGLEITWYKDQKSMSMNLPLSLDQLRHILRLCVQYVIDNRTWRCKA